MSDPVLWAKAFVVANDPNTKTEGPWIARDYQAEMLRDRSLNKVYRCGRRLGKCLPGWIKIIDPTTGTLHTVKELFDKQTATVATMSEQYKLTTQKNCKIVSNGNKSVFRVILKNGNYVDATSNHPLFTANGWKKISELKQGDYVATPNKLSFFGNNEISESALKIIAYMIGDGNCKNGNLRFTQMQGKQLEEMKKIVKDFGCQLVHYKSSQNPYDYGIVKIDNIHNRFYKNKVQEMLENYDVYGHGADDKFIPDVIFTLSRNQISIFFSRLYSTDGWAYSRYTGTKYELQIGYVSNSELLVRQIQHLLLRFGIYSKIRQKTEKAWEVDIYRKNDALKFIKEIGIYGKESSTDKIIEAAKNIKETDSFMPFEINQQIEEKMKLDGVNKSDLVKLWGNPRIDRLRLNQYKLQKWKAKKIAKYLKMNDLLNLIDANINWQEIVDIKLLGNFETYDLSVPNTHNFVANDVIVHNTELMCIESLWKIFTNKNFRVLYIAPYENQVNLFFMRIKELIASSPMLNKEVSRIRNSPYTIELSNGSALLGFTTGASSGQGAANVRGQRGDALFLDELDYMADLDYSTVAMIAAERPDITTVASSTPTGKRGIFWRMCVDKKLGYTEHYHSSMENPAWCQQMEDDFRARLTPVQYEHEVMAEFGSEESGVFNKDKVDAAMKKEWYAYSKLTESQKNSLKGDKFPKILDYSLEKQKTDNKFICVGVDWDKYGASSSIIVLEYDVKINKFRVIKRIEVPRSEYTIDNAVQWVIKVNEIYNPAWIYCDRGYGDFIQKMEVFCENIKRRTIQRIFENNN